MRPDYILTSALISAAVALLIQATAYLQAKTTARAIQARPATRHAVPQLPRRATEPAPADPAPEHPGPVSRPYADTMVTHTAGAPAVPQTRGAPAPHVTSHAAPAARVWTDPTWPPADDDTHVTQAVP